jgi:prepilin-type N-terminal cleavage/methylation domain-containing protein
MVRRGFTIVELIITITIMGILLLLAVVNVNGTQMQARDNERKIDVDAIANHMENYYKVGSSGSTSYGTYPSTATSSATNIGIRSTLEDIDIKSLLAPGITDETYKTLISATNTVQTTTGVLPQPDKDHYVYQPLQNGATTLCTAVIQGCQKFNLYYMTEADNMVYMVTSKNQ